MKRPTALSPPVFQGFEIALQVTRYLAMAAVDTMGGLCTTENDRPSQSLGFRRRLLGDSSGY